jgi:hypothetical protein
MAYAHNFGYIHRDLAARNVLVGADERTVKARLRPARCARAACARAHAAECRPARCGV